MGASRVVIVIPSIVPETTEACLATFPADIIGTPPSAPIGYQRHATIQYHNGPAWCDGKPMFRFVVVWNNPRDNRGVAGSWNIGRDECLRTEADFLMIMSAAVRLRRAGNPDRPASSFHEMLSLLYQIQAANKHNAYEGKRPIVAGEAGNGLGWHLIAFTRDVLAKVGPFDEAFSPAYHEDNDYSWRIQCAYGLTPADYPLWPKVAVDAHLTEVAHGIKRGGVTVDLAGLADLYVRKWGGVSGSERWCHPYDDDALDFTFTGPYPA